MGHGTRLAPYLLLAPGIAFLAVFFLVPLYYLANGLRDTIVRDQGFVSVLPEFGVLLGVTAVLAALSLRTFRWE